MASLFNKDIQYLKGVGDKRARLFKKLGTPTVGALLRFYPRTYEDWSHPYAIDTAPTDTVCCVKASVASRVVETRIRSGMTLYKFRVCDGVSVMQITLFNSKYAAARLVEGNEFIFYGRVTGGSTHREMSAPLFEPAETGKRIHPIYPQTEGLRTRQIESAVSQALLLLPESIRDPLTSEIRAQYNLCDLKYAIEKIHFPQSLEEMERAKKRLVFEEFLILQLGLLQLKGHRRTESHQHIDVDCTDDFFKLLPFRPTGAQRRAVFDCVRDMKEGTFPMNRLIQGDVGSGKTAVAAAVCHTVVKNGLQAAFMVPTEILAEQHYHSLKAFFEKTDISIALLTGSTPIKQKRKLLSALEQGDIQLVIGTHALLSEDVRFFKLGLVITDEQHRFGVAQRATLAAKGTSPHLMVMSATPIPRTLALMLYGDLDVSVLDELPPGRQKIDTFWIHAKQRKRAFTFLKKQLDAGRQGYIVCPLVEEGENDMAAAQEYAEELMQNDFSQYGIGLLHGRLKSKEKEKVMRDFADGKLDLLVSTTVIEVGVDVPNAAFILIENAERFGLSQLHQLRGRVGRGKEKSYCILISDAQNEETKRRLSAMCRTNDGFEIAEEDLKLRGPGEFFGARQHGLPCLQIADMVADMDALHQAQEAAHSILANDPNLSLPYNRGLQAETRRLFAKVGEGGLN